MKKNNGMFQITPTVRLVSLLCTTLILAACGSTEVTKSNKSSVAAQPKQPAYVFKTAGYGNSEKIMFREPSGKQRVVDGTGLVSAPTLSADGQRVAYLKQTWGKSHDIHIKDLRTNKVQILPVKNATRFGMAWSPDGRHFYYSAVINNQAGKATASRALNTYDVAAKKVVWSHLTPPPGRMSVSPNNRYVAYITRDMKQPNDADAWILRLYDKQLNKYRQMGNATDNKAVLGRILWDPKSTNFSVASFDLAVNGKRQNVRMAKYNLAFEEIGTLQLSDVIYSPQHHPRFVTVKNWLHSKPQNGKVYGLTPFK